MESFRDYEAFLKYIQERGFTARILESSVDVHLQQQYFLQSAALKKSLDETQDYLPLTERLYNPEVSTDEKKNILITLASFGKVEYYHAIEQFLAFAEGELKGWATMALSESKMMLEADLLETPMLYISSGLGGKNNALRYFLAIVGKNRQPFTPTQFDMVKKEFEFTFGKKSGEVEEVVLDGSLIKIVCLLPFEHNIGESVSEVIKECNSLGEFIDPNFVLSNVKCFSTEEIMKTLDHNSPENK